MPAAYSTSPRLIFFKAYKTSHGYISVPVANLQSYISIMLCLRTCRLYITLEKKSYHSCAWKFIGYEIDFRGLVFSWCIFYLALIYHGMIYLCSHSFRNTWELSWYISVNRMLWSLPNQTCVNGVNFNTEWFSYVTKNGAKICDIPLNKETDVLIASYLRTGRCIFYSMTVYMLFI